jgi:hypothetical protein
MKLRQQARVPKRKALTSFITAAEAFNSPRDDGRVTKVLLHLQHAFEMLLKAALVQAGKPVFDEATGRSIGFERCIGLAMSDDTINCPRRTRARCAMTSSTGSTRSLSRSSTCTSVRA